MENEQGGLMYADNGPRSHGSCGCQQSCPQVSQREQWGIYEYPLAMVYAPLQTFRGLYDPRTALHRGTMFCELDLPLEAAYGGRNTGGCGSNRRGCGCANRNRYEGQR
jgi:hypothetical protein